MIYTIFGRPAHVATTEDVRARLYGKLFDDPNYEEFLRAELRRRCAHCQLRDDTHVGGKCLFEATSFEPMVVA